MHIGRICKSKVLVGVSRTNANRLIGDITGSVNTID
jgi:hypothetical protein